MALSDRDQEAVLWNAREIKSDVDTLVSLLVPTIKDGTGAAPLPDILERTLDVSRRALASVVALEARVAALEAKLTPPAPEV